MPVLTTERVTIEVLSEDRPYLPVGWTLVGDVEATEGVVVLEHLGFYCFHQHWWLGVHLEQMSDCANSSHMLALLRREDEIPLDWQDDPHVFTGTVARDEQEVRRVPGIYWESDQWNRGWVSLEDEIYYNTRVVRVCEPS